LCVKEILGTRYGVKREWPVWGWMAGYDSPEEFIDSIKNIGPQLYVHSEDQKRLMEIIKAEGFVNSFEVEFYRKDGSKFWVVIDARTVKDEQGEVLYVEGLE